MSSTMRWLPAHQAHAIERVCVTFVFYEQIPTKPWQTILNSASVNLPALGFNATVGFGVPAGPGQMFNPPLGLPLFAGGAVSGDNIASSTFGRSFQKIESNELREEIGVFRTHFSYASTRYIRWPLFRDRSAELIEEYINNVLSSVNLQFVKLEYWDRFILKEKIIPGDYLSLLRKDSRHLPSHPLTSEDLWHSHVGYFADCNSASKRLVNANVDVLDLADPAIGGVVTFPLPMARSVGIHTMAQDTLEAAASPSTYGGISSTLEELHTILKQVLADIITAEASDRISLYS